MLSFDPSVDVARLQGAVERLTAQVEQLRAEIAELKKPWPPAESRVVACTQDRWSSVPHPALQEHRKHFPDVLEFQNAREHFYPEWVRATPTDQRDVWLVRGERCVLRPAPQDTVINGVRMEGPVWFAALVDAPDMIL